MVQSARLRLFGRQLAAAAGAFQQGFQQELWVTRRVRAGYRPNRRGAAARPRGVSGAHVPLKERTGMKRKVTVVGGAGNVGATVARAIAEKELADVVIIDIADQKASGIALDMYETCPILGSDSRIVGGGDWSAAAGSDIVVITSGKPRKPGMSRDDLVKDNFEIMKSIAPQVVQHCPDSIIVPVANPLDAMAQALYRLTKFPRERVIGMAGVLDSARMSTFIAMELNVRHDGAAAALLDGGGRAAHGAPVEGAD
jgi:threonine dehydrogenase-like Zn-dependent dehydrogenase